jgi:acetyl esterase/lipase
MPACSTVTRENLVYATVEGRELRMNLAWPQDPASVPMPVVLWIHGGGWSGGDHTGTEHLPLAEHGYFSANLEYRLSQEAIFPAQIHDCKAAIRYLRAHADEYGVDPSRFGVWGASAGGHLAALLGTSAHVPALEGDLGHAEQSSEVQAVVDICGPTDLTQVVQAQAEHVIVAEVVDQLLGGPLAEHLELARAASPLAHVGPGSAPYLIIHGELDDVIPLEQSERLEAALRAAGVEATLIRVKGGGHGFGPEAEPNPDQLQELSIQFFDRHLKRE